MEMMQNKSNGPVAALKRSYRKRMLAMTIMPLVIIATNLQHIDKTLTSALFWFYIVFCIGVIIFSGISYSNVKKLEEMDNVVKSTLVQQIALLERGAKQKLIGVRLAILFFIVLLEVLPYLQHFSMLSKWHALSLFIRYGAYVLFFLFIYYFSRRMNYNRFEKHIIRLKELVTQMQ